MRTFVKAASFFVLFLVTVSVSVLWAAWVGDGTPICTAPQWQCSPHTTSDGAGGAIITWYDCRSGNWDIYAQRIDASGAVLWTADGVAICTATGNQPLPHITSDGAGGAIITWQDYRSGNWDIYAQRVNASGGVQWTADGVAICTATLGQHVPQIISDGAGGAIITWGDYRSGSDYDIYAQRVNASGGVQWTADGVAICTATLDQYGFQLTSDSAGGAIITWLDYRSGNWDIYAQRVNASGGVQWTANGVAICTATLDQENAQITSDGAGGAIITWDTGEFSGSSGWYNCDICAQRVNASGVLQWTADGVAICTATDNQQYPAITSDGAGGAIITWDDCRTRTSADIYAQRVDASGSVLWTADGAPICTATGNQHYPTITSDGAGGAIITWEDYRSGNYDIYAQRVNASGGVQWTADGAAICTATLDQDDPQPTSDGVGGAIITWEDCRGGSYYYYDIYAQRVSALGNIDTTPPQVAVVSPNGSEVFSVDSQDTIRWVATDDVAVDSVSIYYSIDGGATFPFTVAGGEPNDSAYVWTVPDTPSDSCVIRIVAYDPSSNTGQDVSDAFFSIQSQVGAGLVPEVARFGLLENHPNPFNPMTRIEFGLDRDAKVCLRIYDVSGKIVRTLVQESLAAGRHTAIWNGEDESGKTVVSGVYICRLEAEGKMAMHKIVLLK